MHDTAIFPLPLLNLTIVFLDPVSCKTRKFRRFT